MNLKKIIKVAKKIRYLLASEKIELTEEENDITKNPTTNKTFQNLISELRWLGKGVLGEFLISQTLKTCGTTSSAVINYLLEKGFIVSRAGVGKYSGHFDLSVLTSDAGWVGVDPTYMQFHCKWWVSEEEEDSPEEPDFENLQTYFKKILNDGINAFEITPNLNDSYKTQNLQEEIDEPWDGIYDTSKNWTKYWEEKRKTVDNLLSGKPQRRQRLYDHLL